MLRILFILFTSLFAHRADSTDPTDPTPTLIEPAAIFLFIQNEPYPALPGFPNLTQTSGFPGTPIALPGGPAQSPKVLPACASLSLSPSPATIPPRRRNVPTCFTHG